MQTLAILFGSALVVGIAVGGLTYSISGAWGLYFALLFGGSAGVVTIIATGIVLAIRALL